MLPKTRNRLHDWNGGKTDNRIFQRALPWVAFLLVFLWIWRVPNLFTHLPVRETWITRDALEIIWGIEWYHDQLTQLASPLFYQNIFYPAGFQVGSLAHTPTLFLLALPFAHIGGSVFAYNVLALLPFLIGYVGALRFFRLAARPTFAIVAALIYTFITMRSLRATAHLNIWWATAILPYFGYYLLNYARTRSRRHAVLIGLSWGIMLNFSLYSVFLGAAAIFAVCILRKPARSDLVDYIAMGGVAFLVGLPALIPFWLAAQAARVSYGVIDNLVPWGVSPDCLFTPPYFHSWQKISDLHLSVCVPTGVSEGVWVGLTMGILAVVGVVLALIHKHRPSFPVMRLLLITIVLALGPYLYFRGDLVEAPRFAPLNRLLWQAGHLIKPDLFPTADPGLFATKLPMPDLILMALVPLAEGARVAQRYVFVALLGLGWFIAVALDRFPKWLSVVFICLLFLELAPPPFHGQALTEADIHGAYAWLRENARDDEGYLDLTVSRDATYGRIMHGGDTLLASRWADTPSASHVGSFLPDHAVFLEQTVEQALTPEAMGVLMDAYGLRFLLLHGPVDSKLYTQLVDADTQFASAGCFEGQADSPWIRPICIVRRLPQTHTVDLDFGWSAEPWGVWAIDTAPHTRFLANGETDVIITIEAFPYCVDDRDQSMQLTVNGQEIGTHTWRDCETASLVYRVPAEQVQLGWNNLSLRLAYAISPADVTTDANIDPRTLAAGFNHLSVKPLVE